MKISGLFAQKEKGQVLVFAALIFLLVIIPLAALFVDGSIVMLNRRQAQAAADAGALAGTRKLCEQKYTTTEVISTATTDYAISKNHATSASASVNGWQVQVNATVSRPSFFAKLIGIPELTSSATATAGCLFPSNNVLPVAFNCPTGPENGCGVSMFDWYVTHIPGPDTKLYILVEASGSLSNKCQPDDPLGMVCDAITTISGLDTPIGKTVRVLGDGAHTYVPDLCNMNVNLCIKAILGDVQPPASTIDALPWVDKKPGVVDTFYQTMAANVPFVYLVPFYTADNGGKVYITMAAQFMVTCASSQANPGSKNDCPGKNAWMNANPGYNSRTFEGYFVKNYPVDLTDPGSGGTANLGVYYVSLIK